MATPAIYAGDTTVGQSGTNAALTVFLREASAMTITVRQSLAAKNAKDGIGSIIQSGVLTFNPGITELAIPAVDTHDNAPRCTAGPRGQRVADHQALALAMPVIKVASVFDVCLPPPSERSPPVLAAGNHHGRKSPPR